MILPLRILKRMCRSSQYGNWVWYLMEGYQAIKCQYFKPTKVFKDHFNLLKGVSNSVPRETSIYKRLKVWTRVRGFLKWIWETLGFFFKKTSWIFSELQCNMKNVALQGGKNTQIFLKIFSYGMARKILSWNTICATKVIPCCVFHGPLYRQRDWLFFYPRLLPIFGMDRTRVQKLRSGLKHFLTVSWVLT